MINNINSNSWMSGFVSGVLATLLGFVLTMIWDIYKYKRDEKNNEEKIMNAVKEELEQNLSSLKYNKELIENELELINEDKVIVPSIINLEEGFWDLVKIHLPKRISEPKNLLKVRKVSQLTRDINEQIRSRENFRINNKALSGYLNQLKLYDLVISERLDSLIDEINQLLPVFRKEKNLFIKFNKWIKNVFSINEENESL